MTSGTLDRYILGEVLGRGGMGVVYEAWDPHLKRTVALKVLFRGDPELRQRLLEEAQAQARLKHPHICPVYELGASDQGSYIAMQRIQGRTLADLRLELSSEQLTRLMADVAGAVHAAHRAGLIHRDLKPSNLLAEPREDGTWHAYVLDFGLAKDVANLDQTLSWAVMGTPAFMSPEQARGEPLTPASDVFSLGATFYALLTGQPPYAGTTLAQLVTRHVRTGVPRLRRLKVDVSRDLETVVLKCLEYEPGQRYGSAFAMEEDLRRVLAGEPISARPVGPVGRTCRWCRRNPRVSWTLAASLSVLALLGGWNVRLSQQSRLREQAAQRFGMEIRDAEHLMRIERMLPVHDIRPAEARLRERMAQIAADMERLGAVARGPGLYALGRGHLTLRDHERAKTCLQEAWAAGFQAPEVAHALGMAELNLWEERVHLECNRLDSTSETQRALNEAKPLEAFRWLALGAGARLEHPDLGAGRVAQANGRYAEADQFLARALNQAPWLAEAAVARAVNALTWSYSERDPRAQAKLWDLHAECLTAAARLQPSDDRMHRHLANLALLKTNRAVAAEGRSAPPDRQVWAHLEDALQVRPDAHGLLDALAHALYLEAWAARTTGADPGPELRRRIQGWSLDLDALIPMDRLATAAHLYQLWGELAELDWRFGRDPEPAMTQMRHYRAMAVEPGGNALLTYLLELRVARERGTGVEVAWEAFRRCEARVEIRPQTHWASTLKAEGWLEWALWQEAQDQDAEPPAVQALAHLTTALQIRPDEVFAHGHLARVRGLILVTRHRRGLDTAEALVHARSAAQLAVKVAPGFHLAHLAAAEAHFAMAQVSLARGGDPHPALEAAFASLQHARRCNPRYFPTDLLQARVARWAMQADPTRLEHHLQVLHMACQQGARLRPDLKAWVIARHP